MVLGTMGLAPAEMISWLFNRAMDVDQIVVSLKVVSDQGSLNDLKAIV
jgi:hypothetical protein